MNKLVLCAAAVGVLAAGSLAADGWGDSSIWTTNTYAAQWLVRLYDVWQTIEPGEAIATKQQEWTAHWREVSRG